MVLARLQRWDVAFEEDAIAVARIERHIALRVGGLEFGRKLPRMGLVHEGAADISHRNVREGPEWLEGTRHMKGGSRGGWVV
jgi:hypothetical protein